MGKGQKFSPRMTFFLNPFPKRATNLPFQML